MQHHLLRRWLAPLAFCLVTLPAFAFQVEMAVTVDADSRPTLSATTNLPEGMRLLVRVVRKESAFQVELPVEVQGGSFSAGPLSQLGAELNPGTYGVEVASVHPADQPDAVRVAIGPHGEELQGPLTKRYSGVTWLRVITTFQIGKAANPQLDEARREQVKLAQTKWWRSNCDEICGGGERYAQQKMQPFDRPACMTTCIANPPTGANR